MKKSILVLSLSFLILFGCSNKNSNSISNNDSEISETMNSLESSDCNTSLDSISDIASENESEESLSSINSDESTLNNSSEDSSMEQTSNNDSGLNSEIDIDFPILPN